MQQIFVKKTKGEEKDPPGCGAFSTLTSHVGYYVNLQHDPQVLADNVGYPIKISYPTSLVHHWHFQVIINFIARCPFRVIHEAQ